MPKIPPLRFIPLCIFFSWGLLLDCKEPEICSERCVRRFPYDQISLETPTYFSTPDDRQNNDVHVLIHGTCEYVTLCNKRDFAGLMKVQDLEIGRLS